MPSRPSSRPAAGPGRGTGRSSSRTGGGRPSAAEPTPADGDSTEVVRRRSSLTTRAVALAVVLLVLVISYAGSLRIYVSQRSHIIETRQQIADRQAGIADLQGELAQWNNPDYVRAQARQRLGWVVPGETGYKVIGPDGKPLDGGVEIDTTGTSLPEAEPAWWAKLWGSARAADDPAPAKPTEPPVITQNGPR